jgi:nicotinamide-nucleotide amidase
LNTPQPVNAEIIAIGTEILLGELTDTNSVYLARALRDMGIDVYFMTSVGDNERRIESAVRIALGRARIVLTCGGLGPTVDDMTRGAVAAAADRSLVFHETLLEQIANRFSSFRVQMTENNRRQAYVPEGAVIIDNPVGTAPAFAVEVDDRVIISLPGVPREMKYLMTERVIPWLRERYGLKSEIIKARVLKVAGIGESALDEMIGTELLNSANPTIGLNAHSGQIDVRITAKADHADAADALIAPLIETLRARIGRYIYGMDDARLEDALVSALMGRAVPVCVAEVGVQTEIVTRLKPFGSARIEFSGQYNRPHDLIVDLNLPPGGSLRAQAEAAAAELCARYQGAALVIISEQSGGVDSADAAEHTAAAVGLVGRPIISRGYGFGVESEAAHVWTTTWTMAMLWRMLTDESER